MEKLRETLNPEEQLNAFGHPTLYKTATNTHALHCQACAQAYYVDEKRYHEALSGLAGDHSEIRFICDACENEYAIEDHGH